MARPELEIVDVVARLRALRTFPWRCVSSLDGRNALAAMATILGAGLMGAMVLVRSLPHWLRHGQNPIRHELTVPGLQNSGNNCFLNAILQALASSQKFATYLRAYDHLEGDDSELRLSMMPLSSALCQLLEELGEVAPGHRIVSPRDVMRLLGYYARSFDLGKQQDAAEALSHLAAALQQERMEDFEDYRATLQSLADVSVVSKQMQRFIHPQDLQGKLALNYWQQQLRWPMEGTYGSLIKCSRCGFEGSIQFQFFRDLSLALPRSASNCIRNNCTIEDCLDQYTMLERISDFQCIRCAHLASACLISRTDDNKDLLKTLQDCGYDDKCVCEALLKQEDRLWSKLRGEAYKCLRVGRCPEVLCLHLQRVIVNSSGYLEKLTDYVSFSTTLDLSPFTIATQQTISSATSDSRLHNTTMSHFFTSIGSTMKCIGGASASVEQEPDFREGPDDELETAPMEVDDPIEQPEDHDFSQPEPSNNSNSDQLSAYKSKDKSQLYDLISVVVHHGSPTSGHYTVYRKVKVPRHQIEMRSTTPKMSERQYNSQEILAEQESEEKVPQVETVWFAISDADVVKVSEEEVLEASATLLFYERQ